MIFNNIEDVKRYMRFLRDSSQEGSKWFGDFNWFSSNKIPRGYTQQVMFIAMQCMKETCGK